MNLIDFPCEPWYNISKYEEISGGEVLCRFSVDNAENWKGNLIYMPVEIIMQITGSAVYDY